MDGRWVRAGGGHPSVTEEVREAIFAVRAETRNRSRVSMKARCVLIAQYAAEKFGPQVPVPGYWTLRDGWGPEMEWPYPGVPASVVADFAGHRVAGLPFFAPETVTTDHGGPYN